MRLTRFTVAACCAAALVLTGCSSKQPGDPGPSTGVTNPTTTSSAPAVANPLAVTKIQGDPCGALTDAQLAPVMGAVRKHESSSDSDGPTCTWFPVDGHRASVSLNVYPSLGGPTGLYGQQKMYSFFKKIDPVSGYPAVHASTLGTVAGACQTIVAVSDQAGFGVFAQNSSSTAPDYPNMCAGPDQLVPQLISSLKTGG